MPAGPSTDPTPFPKLLCNRHYHDMMELDDIPDECHIYYQLLPEQHAAKFVLATTDTEEARRVMEDQAEVANFLATLAEESLFERIAARVGRIPFEDDDLHRARPWVRLGWLLYYRAQDFGALSLDGVTAAQNVLSINDPEEDTQAWPDSLKEVWAVPRLDKLLTAPPTEAIKTGNWVKPADVADTCIVNPVFNAVSAAPLSYAAALRVVPPSTADLTTHGHSAPQTVEAAANAEPPRRSERNKPSGKARRIEQRATLPSSAPGPQGTNGQDDISGARPTGKGNTSTSSSSSSSSSSLSSSSSSDDEPPRAAAGSAQVARTLTVPVHFLSDGQVTSPPAADTPMVVFPLDNQENFPPLTGPSFPIASSAPVTGSFTFPVLPPRQMPPAQRFADLFGHSAGTPASAGPVIQNNTDQGHDETNAGVPVPDTTQAAVHSIPVSDADLPETGTNHPDLDTAGGTQNSMTVLHQRILNEPGTLKLVCQWYMGPQGRANKPAVLKNLTDPQLDEVETKLEPWISHFTAAPPSSTVSNPPPVSHVPVQPAQPSSSTAPAPAVETPPVSTQETPVVMPMANPIFGGGRSRIKLPSLQHYNGNADSSKPKIVLAWLRQMQLALQQDKSTDPVSIAIMHLEGNAANWRDTVFLPMHDAQAVIPWSEFEQEFKSRFMDRVSCMEALKEFRQLKQRSKQSVEDFNLLLIQRRMELERLPYISVPDMNAQVDIYLAGLLPEISQEIQKRADLNLLDSLPYWMNEAALHEALKKTMQMRSEAHAQTQTHSNNADAQKKRASTSSKETAQKSGTADSGSKPAKRSKGSKPPFAKQQEVYPDNIVPKGVLNGIPQYNDRNSLHSPVLSREQLQEAKSNAKLSVIDKASGIRYPNVHYRKLNRRNCEANKLCYFCFKSIPEAHPARDCPSPAYNKEVTLAAATAACETTIAIDKKPQGSPQLQIAASVQAVPFKNVTMLFAGTVQGQQRAQRVTVLLDTGSSHNVCSPNVQKLHKSSTGKTYSVSCAGSNAVRQASEYDYKLFIQNISTEFSACEMALPAGVDVLLGQSWMSAHQATLLTWSGQVNFLDVRNYLLVGKNKNVYKITLSTPMLPGEVQHLSARLNKCMLYL